MLNRFQMKAYRELRGVTQEAVAMYSGISQALVAQIENGNRAITVENHREYLDGVNTAYQKLKEQKQRMNEKDDKEIEKNNALEEKKENAENVELPKETIKKTTTRKRTPKK